MAIFHATSWTGGSSTVEVDVIRPAQRMESAPKKLKPRVDIGVMQEDAVEEYKKIAAEIGISDQDMLVEEFRIFLVKYDIPTFNHHEVVSYMDEIAAKDNPTKLGWHWCPVRAKDAETPLTFGRPSCDERYHSSNNPNNGGLIPASDFYESHSFVAWHQEQQNAWRWRSMSSGHNQTTVHVESNVRIMQAAHDEVFQRPPTPRDWRQTPSPAYTRTLPLHALKKIALVEREFKAGQVLFLVTDYTTAPHIIVNPDPFLMAIIPNSAVAHGKGRFIIDMWDEPGFGIDRMVK